MAERKSRTDKKTPASTAGNDVARADDDYATNPEPKAGETESINKCGSQCPGVESLFCSLPAGHDGVHQNAWDKWSVGTMRPRVEFERSLPPLPRKDRDIGHVADVFYRSGIFGSLTPARIATQIIVGESLGLNPAQAMFDLEITPGASDAVPGVRYRSRRTFEETQDALKTDDDRGTPEPASVDQPRGVVVHMPDATLKAGETVTLEGITTGTDDGPPRCPTCYSLDPARHPAVQFEGEVSICKDAFHDPASVKCAMCSVMTPKVAVQHHFTNENGLQVACSPQCRDDGASAYKFSVEAGTLPKAEPDTMPEHCPVCMSIDPEKHNGPEPCKDPFHDPARFDLITGEPLPPGPCCEHPEENHFRHRFDDWNDGCNDCEDNHGYYADPSDFEAVGPRDDENDEQATEAGPVPETLSGAEDRENSGQFQSVGDVLAAAGMSEAEIQQRTANAAVAREQARVAEAEEQAIASIAAAKIVEAPDGTKFDVSDLATPDQASGSVTPEPASPADNAEPVVAGPPLTADDCSIYRETIVNLLRELGYDNDAIRERLNKFDVSTDDEKRELVVNYGNFYASKTDAIRDKVIEQLALDGKPTTELQKGFLIFAAVPTNPAEWTYAQALKAFQALSDYKR